MVRVIAAFVLIAGAASAQHSVFTYTAMGTEFELRIALPYEESEAFAVDAFNLITEIEDEISSWKETSYTTYVNRRAAEAPIRVSAGVLDLFVQARDLSRVTYGAFDPTVGPLLDAWKIRRGGQIASEAAIERARQIVGMQLVRIDETESTIAFERAGVWVDWGAIGKGYALDRVADQLRDRGVASALVSAGTSSIVAIGEVPWGVKIPSTNQDTATSVVLLTNAALSTSLCIGNTSAPCDILDPRVGRPVSGAASATVIASTGTVADALSTALLVMSRDEAERFFEEHSAYRAIRYDNDGAPEKYNWNNRGTQGEP